MPWNIRRALEQANDQCYQFFLIVAGFTCRGLVGRNKPLSFHPEAVSCFNKGKVSKGIQFGRAFQLGRLGGNFLPVGECNSLRLEDKALVRPMITEHQNLFGEGALHSLGTDKGYYSDAIRNHLRSVEGLVEVCLRQPAFDTQNLSEGEPVTYARIVDRRAGIEPLIDHAKHGGQWDKSRLKCDETTLAAGYGSIGGFSLRQLIRHVMGNDISPVYYYSAVVRLLVI